MFRSATLHRIRLRCWMKTRRCFQTIDDVAKGETVIRFVTCWELSCLAVRGSMKKVKVLSGVGTHPSGNDKVTSWTGQSTDSRWAYQSPRHEDKDILKQALLDFDGTLIVVSMTVISFDGLVSKVCMNSATRKWKSIFVASMNSGTKKMESLQSLKRNNVKVTFIASAA